MRITLSHFIIPAACLFVFVSVVTLGGFLARWIVVVPGEVVVIHQRASGDVVRVYDRPGRHWRDISRSQMAMQGFAKLQIPVGGPIFVESKPVEAYTHEGASITVAVNLTLAVTDPPRYAIAVVRKQVDVWREGTLPALIASVIPRYTVPQILTARERVARDVAAAVAADFADRTTRDLGLDLTGAALVDVSTRGHWPPSAAAE
jgi:regulator of protease activity HflC (stomatin/prohibitin superfamily)